MVVQPLAEIENPWQRWKKGNLVAADGTMVVAKENSGGGEK